MEAIASGNQKPIAQPGEQKTARKDTSVAVSRYHKDYLDSIADTSKKSVREVLAEIIQGHMDRGAA